MSRFLRILAFACALLPVAGQAEKPAFTDAEIQKILSFGPWPATGNNAQAKARMRRTRLMTMDCSIGSVHPPYRIRHPRLIRKDEG